MRKFYVLIFLLTNLLAYSSFSQVIVGSDNAGNYGSGNPWENNSNGGTGFGDWNLTANGGGHFLSSSVGDDFGDINTATKAFGMWGNPSGDNYAHATRQITEWKNLYSFEIDLAIAWRSGSKGIKLIDVDDNVRFTFSAEHDKYQINGSEIIPEWSHHDESIFHIRAFQKAGDLLVTVSRGDSLEINTLIPGVVLHEFMLFVENTNNTGPKNNLFFNNLIIKRNDVLLFDDFNRPDNNVVGIPSGNPGGAAWTEYETNSVDSAVKIFNNTLEMSLKGANNLGKEIVSYNMTDIYPIAFDEATDTLRWAWNWQHNRGNLGGFVGNAYGMAFIIGCNKPNFADANAWGYAVVQGGAGNKSDSLRLVRFKGGINGEGNFKKILAQIKIGSNQNNPSSVMVEYNSINNKWILNFRNDGFSFLCPIEGTYTLADFGVDYDSTFFDLPYSGFLWNHSNPPSSLYRLIIDNLYVPSPSIPTDIEYVWIGEVNDKYTEPGNWSPTRTHPRKRDRLVFEGPGNFEIKEIPDQTIGQLIVRNVTNIGRTQVFLKNSTSSYSTLKITGGKGLDFLVDTNSTLNLDTRSNDNPNGMVIEMLTNTTGEVRDSVIFNNTSNAYEVNKTGKAHQILVADGNALIIKNGGVVYVKYLSGNPFGNSGIGNTIVFKPGSKYISQRGGNPFGLAAPNSKVLFEPGSRYVHMQTSNLSLINRKYADFEIDFSGSVNFLSAGNSPWYVDSIIVTNGIFNLLPTNNYFMNVECNGNIKVADNATFNINNHTNPSTLSFIGTNKQRIYGDGNFTLGDKMNVVIDKPSSTDSVIIDKELTIQRNLFIKKGWVASNEKLTVDKNVVMGEGSDEGRLSLSPGFGGDLELGGDFIINAHGVFNPNNRAVFFTGNTDQTITSHNPNNEVTYNYLVVNKPGGDLILDSSPGTTVNVNGSTGDVLVLAVGDIDLNGQTFNLGGDGGEIKVEGSSGSSRTIKSDIAANFNFTGKKKVSSQGSLELIFDDSITVALTTSSVQSFGVDFGAGNPTVIKGTLRIDQYGFVDGNSPHYDIGGVLQYNTNGVYRRRLEWQNTEGSAGFPNHVIIGGNTILDAGGENGENVLKEFGARLDVRIDNGSSLYMDYDGHHMKVPLKVGRDLIIHGNLSASDSPGGDIHVGRDWLRTSTGSFNPKNRQVLFNGTGPQTITAPGVAGETFDWLGFDSTGTKTLNSDITVNKKLEIFANSGALNAGDKIITLKGDWENKAGLNGFDAGTSTVIFNGEQTQYFDAPTAKVENFYKVKIDNSEGVLLKDKLGINYELILESGIVNFDDANLEVHYRKDAISSEGKANSYINGKARKTWGENTDLFVFPVGQLKDTIDVYQPAGLTPQSSNAQFTVDYVHENLFPGTWVPGNPPSMEPPLETVSGCDYWNIDRTDGSAGAKVRLYWSEKCFDIQDPNQLVVAKIDGGSWVSMGPSTTSSAAPYESGYVETTGFVSAFSPFAIGSSSSINVLPIELISFDATVRDGVVETHWVTATEKNNAYFTVERSVDARHFTEVGRVEGAGNSTVKNTYSLTDPAPYSGISYYRLKQTDFDGNYTYSEIRSVRIDRDSKFELIKAYRSELGLHLAYRSETEVLHAEIFDLVGKKIYRTQIRNTGGFSTIHPNLVRGIYLLRLSNGMEAVTEKFFW